MHRIAIGKFDEQGKWVFDRYAEKCDDQLIDAAKNRNNFLHISPVDDKIYILAANVTKGSKGTKFFRIEESGNYYPVDFTLHLISAWDTHKLERGSGILDINDKEITENDFALFREKDNTDNVPMKPLLVSYWNGAMGYFIPRHEPAESLEAEFYPFEGHNWIHIDKEHKTTDLRVIGNLNENPEMNEEGYRWQPLPKE